MAEFAYNNAKHASNGHTLFELNCSYHTRISFKEDTNLCCKSKSAEELSAELKKLMIVCQKNLYHAQELQKQAHNKGVKLRSYALSNKVWLNTKYIKTNRNWKLKSKFFEPFQVLHPIEKQVYKLELSKKWRIHDVFHMSLLEHFTTRKGRVGKNDAAELDAGNNKSKEYEVERICNSAVYAKESKSGHIPRLY